MSRALADFIARSKRLVTLTGAGCKMHQLITQNVDDLHHEAGSRAVVQLHCA